MLGLAPSAGGLSSVGVYVVPLLVEELPAGVFDYDRDGHRLVLRVPAVSRVDMAAALVQPEFAQLAAVLVVLTIRSGPGVAKYGLGHVRTMAVDVGIAAQNLYLVTTGLGLAGCAIAGFRDEVVSRLLRLSEDEVPTLLFAVGPRPDPV